MIPPIYGNIDTLISEGNERAAADAIHYGAGNWEHEQQNYLKKYAGRFKDMVVLFDLFVSVYINDGYEFPKMLVRKWKNISKVIPEAQRIEGLPEGDTLTVWRGTYTNERKENEVIQYMGVRDPRLIEDYRKEIYVRLED